VAVTVAAPRRRTPTRLRVGSPRALGRSPARSAPAGVLWLQRTAGNAATSGLLVQRSVVDDLGRVLAGGVAALKKALSPPLKAGDKGSSVLSLQQSLNRVGAALIEDSIFGARTRAAVAAFQRDHGVRPILGAGTVDEATWDALRLGGRATASAAPGLGSVETWASMPAQRRADFTTLGYTVATWRSKSPPLAALLPYSLLTEKQRAAVTRLGYTRESWRANRDTTAGTAAKGFAAEEAAAKRKAGAGVLPAKYVGSLRAKAMIAAEFGGDVTIQLAKVHLLSEAEMKRTYEGYYGAGSYTPINGFTVKPDIYLSRASVWAGTTVHESLHVQEHASWDAFAYSPTSAFGEGATRILTELVMARHEQPVTQHPYAAQVALVQKMNTHAGLDKMRTAYFKGATGDYQTAVTAGLKPGTTWAQFRALVDAGALAAARARLT
jgi:peptidoglycan hydrolase-like protein with peptidoglycan-binding domain